MRGEPFLVVRLNGREYAIPTDHLAAMFLLRGQRLLPCLSPSVLRYRLAVHGQWMPVGLPHQALGLRPRSHMARAGIVLVERHTLPDPSVPFGVIVDLISRLDEFRPADIRLEPAGVFLGLLKISGKWRPILDLDAIFPHAAVLAASRRLPAA